MSRSSIVSIVYRAGAAAAISVAVSCVEGCAWGPRLVPTAPASSSVSPAQSGEKLDEGAKAFAQRENRAEAVKAVEFWRQSAVLSDGFDVRIRLARAEHFLALTAPATEKKERFARGAEDALRALRILGVSADDACAAKADAKALPAIYWRAENLDGWARMTGMVGSAKERKVVSCLAKRAVELDESFFYAGPLRLRGRLLAQAPALAGGDAEGSAKAFEKAQSLAPGFLLTRVDYASSLAVKLQNRAAFDSAIDSVLAAEADSSEIGPENAIARARAKELKAQVNELFR